MDFAIIETGGKQYKITSDSVLNIERLTAKAGEKVVFDKVLMIVDGDSVEIGTPYLNDTTFEAVVEDHIRGAKIRILRFRHKARWRKLRGHRQEFSVVNFDVKNAKKVKATEAKAEEKASQAVKTEKKETPKVEKKTVRTAAAQPVEKKAPAKRTPVKKVAKTEKKKQ